jgi:hypothetical protein
MSVNSACRYHFLHLHGSLSCRQVLRHAADGFNPPTQKEEVVLLIFIALKILSSSAGFEPTTIGSNGKHDNHYTMENNYKYSRRNIPNGSDSAVS